MTTLRLSTLFVLTATLVPAAVILNSPSEQSGFFDGNGVSPTFLSGISSSLLPEANGLASQKIWGQATLGAGTFGPYILLLANGTASGTLDADTTFTLHYDFSIPNLGPEVPFFIEGALSTSEGYFYAQETLFTPSGGTGVTVAFKKDGGGTLVPAGTEVFAWNLTLAAGSFGSGDGPKSLTLTIPSNSLEFLASSSAVTTAVPEPAAIGLSALGLLICVSMKRRCSAANSLPPSR